MRAGAVTTFDPYFQGEHQLEEQLFSLYHKERRIDVIVDAIKDKQKELDKMVREWVEGGGGRL